MAAIAGWKCDGCGIEKTPSNKWWKIFLIEGGVLILEWGAVPNEDPVLSHDKEAFNPKEADAHICGNNCITKCVSENLLSKT